MNNKSNSIGIISICVLLGLMMTSCGILGTTPTPTPTITPTAAFYQKFELVATANGFIHLSSSDNYCNSPCLSYMDGYNDLVRWYKGDSIYFEFDLETFAQKSKISIMQKIVKELYPSEVEQSIFGIINAGLPKSKIEGSSAGYKYIIFPVTNLLELTIYPSK